MQKITPFLWFDKEAGEAAQFYTSIFKDSKIKNSTTLHNTPSGTVEAFERGLSRHVQGKFVFRINSPFPPLTRNTPPPLGKKYCTILVKIPYSPHILFKMRVVG